MRPWALIGVASLVLLFFLTSCAEENCDELEDSFFFGKDDCWADKAKDSRDPTICAEKVSSSINKFTCFTGVAAEAQDVKICADYLAYLEKTGSAPVTKVSEYDVCVIAVAKAKGDVNVCAQNLKDKKGRMEQCARDVNQAKVSARVEACKKQSQAKADLCLIEVAKEFKDGSVCSFTSLESKGVCVIALAEELEDPKPILDNYVAGDERDVLVATYAMSSLDIESWKHIQNPRAYDGAVIMTPIAAYVELKKVPIPAYCDALKGGYSGEYAEDDFEVNENLCEGVVAAFNELRDGNDACNTMLSSRIQDEDDLASAKENCASFVSQYRSIEKRVAEANTPEEYQALLNELEE